MHDENIVFLLIVSLPIGLAGILYLFFKRRRGQSKLKIRTLLIGNMLMFLLFTSLLLLCGEVYYRFVFDTTDSFGLAKTTKRWFDRYFQRNNWGIRDSVDYKDEVSPGKVRITFLGDSFTAGHGVRNVENRFTNRIRAMRPKWDVQTIAVCGWETGNQISALGHLSKQYQVDTVVLVYCLNDLCDIIPEFQTFHRELNTIQPPYFFEHSAFLNTIYSRWVAARYPQVTNYYQGVRHHYQGVIWERQQQRLNALRREVQARGGRLVIVTFPFLHSLGPDYKFHETHKVLGEFWRTLEVPHLDLIEVYQSLESKDLMVNKRDPHPNEFAHRLAAESIVRFLDQHAVSGEH